MSYFDNIIGQPEVKRQLGFLIDGYKSTGTTNNLIFNAKRGAGKTILAREFSRNLVIPETKRIKPMIEFNAGEIKGVNPFFSDIVIPHIVGNHLTVFIDEAHEINKSLMNILLSVLAPTGDNVNWVTHQGNSYEFNFYRLTFLFATTNMNKLSKPFQDRLMRLELSNYGISDLLKIMRRNLPKDIHLMDNLGREIMSTVRSNPRQTVRMARNIEIYARNNKKHEFDARDWKILKYTLNIKPLGLNPIEIQALNILNRSNGATLTHLASKLQLDGTTVRNDTESFLLDQDLIKIDGKRFITQRGVEVLKEIGAERVP